MISYHKAFFFLFSFFAFFPYVSMNILNVDSQPYFFLLAVLYLINARVNINLFIYLICFVLLLLLFSFLDIINEPDYFLVFRAAINYLTIFLGVLVFCLIYKKISLDFIFKLLNIYLYIYLFSSIIQISGVSDLSFISPNRGALHSGRGVSSLAAEPTFYGIIILFIGLYYILLSKIANIHTPLIIYFLVFINLVFSMSSTAFIFFFLYVIINFLNFKSLLYIFFIFIALFLLIYFNFSFLDDSRLGYLFKLFTENGFSFFKLDASANERLSAVYFPYQGFFDNYMLPNFFSSYSSYSSSARELSSFFWYGSGGKIMNYLGSFVFELGVFGLFFVFLISYKMISSNLLSIPNCLLLILLLNVSVPLSSGYVCAVFSLFFYNEFKINKTPEGVT